MDQDSTSQSSTFDRIKERYNTNPEYSDLIFDDPAFKSIIFDMQGKILDYRNLYGYDNIRYETMELGNFTGTDTFCTNPIDVTIPPEKATYSDESYHCPSGLSLQSETMQGAFSLNSYVDWSETNANPWRFTYRGGIFCALRLPAWVTPEGERFEMTNGNRPIAWGDGECELNGNIVTNPTFTSCTTREVLTSGVGAELKNKKRDILQTATTSGVSTAPGSSAAPSTTPVNIDNPTMVPGSMSPGYDATIVYSKEFVIQWQGPIGADVELWVQSYGNMGTYGLDFYTDEQIDIVSSPYIIYDNTQNTITFLNFQTSSELRPGELPVVPYVDPDWEWGKNYIGFRVVDTSTGGSVEATYPANRSPPLPAYVAPVFGGKLAAHPRQQSICVPTGTDCPITDVYTKTEVPTANEECSYWGESPNGGYSFFCVERRPFKPAVVDLSVNENARCLPKFDKQDKWDTKTAWQDVLKKKGPNRCDKRSGKNQDAQADVHQECVNEDQCHAIGTECRDGKCVLLTCSQLEQQNHDQWLRACANGDVMPAALDIRYMVIDSITELEHYQWNFDEDDFSVASMPWDYPDLYYLSKYQTNEATPSTYYLSTRSEGGYKVDQCPGTQQLIDLRGAVKAATTVQVVLVVFAGLEFFLLTLCLGGWEIVGTFSEDFKPTEEADQGSAYAGVCFGLVNFICALLVIGQALKLGGTFNELQYETTVQVDGGEYTETGCIGVYRNETTMAYQTYNPSTGELEPMTPTQQSEYDLVRSSFDASFDNFAIGEIAEAAGQGVWQNIIVAALALGGVYGAYQELKGDEDE